MNAHATRSARHPLPRRLPWGRAGRLAAALTALLVFAALLTSPAPAQASGDTYRTEIIFLKSLSVERAIALYERVIGVRSGTRVVEGHGADTVVVRDTPHQLARFRALLGVLDRADRGRDGEQRLYLRPVVHLAPSDLADLVRSVLDGHRLLAEVLMAPDDRSGQLVVRTTRDRYLTLDRLMRRLDVPARDRERAIRTLPAIPDIDELPL